MITPLNKLIQETITALVPVSEEREAILEAIKLEDKFGESKSINILDKYEEIIESLIK
jgi:hypothetical protein